MAGSMTEVCIMERSMAQSLYHKLTQHVADGTSVGVIGLC